jgi:cobalt-zinc-cadmium efflux system outer membrane protein
LKRLVTCSIRIVARCTLASLSACTVLVAHAQSSNRSIRLDEYLRAVEASNLDLLSQREGVVSARAGVSVAGVRPDPQLTLGVVSRELYGPNKPNATTPLTAGVALTIETAGKRGARIRAAESNVMSTQALLDAARDQWLIDASAAFVEDCRSREVLVRKQSSLRSLRDTVRANETRFKAGDIGQLELRQSRVEADRFAADVNAAAADAEAARINLSVPLGQQFDTVFAGATPDCELRAQATAPDIDGFVAQAMEGRRDVQAAQAAVGSARDAVALARANRWVDPVVSVGLTNTPRINPVVDGSGAVTNSPTLQRSLTLGLTVSVPIPLSRMQDGELRQAESALTRAQLQLTSVLLRAQADVRATHSRFRAVAANEINYREHVLQDADRVLEGARVSYRKGASSLLELLTAQRTADQIALDHLQARADLANATVKLQVNAGMRPDL